MSTFPLELEGVLPLAQTADQIDFWKKLRPVNICAASDTYKRTMACSGEDFNRDATYTIAARKPLSEEGAGNRLIMAGLEELIYPWFGLPVTEKEVRKAEGAFRYASEIRKFATPAWEKVLSNDGHFPLDIWGLPGGQTFLVDKEKSKFVPMLSVEGPGALGSHLEPHMTQIYKSVIAATKARLMYEATGEKFAEFGYRSATNDIDHATLMMAIKVGGGFYYTSNDEAVYLFPKDFTSIGTMGHEYIEAFQRQGRTLEEAQELACRSFITHNEKSALLPDTIDTVRSGLPLILKLILEYQQKDPSKVIMPRFDSGKIDEQIIIWKKMTLGAGLARASMVVEDGYTPAKARETKRAYAAAGFNPDEIIFGAGGYFREENTRDAISVADKRTGTIYDGVHEPSIKFSDDSGKFFPGGRFRVYERGRVLVVAYAGESIDGKLISVPLVKNGRINYFETLADQHARAAQTWGKYDSIEYSPLMQESIDVRVRERNEIRQRL